ncbi:uncharacterized protein [Temnothorax nylanderi]|uniref:uncharacterized protein n=1 Tax=Temnothorax nylanderi TaxID=102681 RepID=UPI003A837AD6
MCSTLHAPYFEQRQSDDDLEDGVGSAKKRRRRVNKQSVELETLFPNRGNVDSRKNTCHDDYYDDDGILKSDVERHPVRILERRYILTKTGYKFIDVGITAVLPCYVHIVIGDCHGKISLSSETWKELVDQKRAVLSHLQRGKNERAPPPMCIENGHLTLRFGKSSFSSVLNGGTFEVRSGKIAAFNSDLERFGKINNLSTLRLETSTTRLIVSMNTVLHMFNLDLCVNRLVTSLRAITGMIDAKLTRFIAIAATVTDPANVPRAIRESEFFDSNDIVDCELAALCFGNTEKLL